MNEELIMINGKTLNKKEILEFLNKGKKVKALKYIVKKTNLDLLSAKKLMDQFIEQENNKNLQNKHTNHKTHETFIVRNDRNFTLTKWMIIILMIIAWALYYVLN